MRDGLGARICGVVVDHNTGPGTGPAPGYYPRGPGNKGKDEEEEKGATPPSGATPPPLGFAPLKPGAPYMGFVWGNNKTNKRIGEWIREQLDAAVREFQVEMIPVPTEAEAKRILIKWLNEMPGWMGLSGMATKYVQPGAAEDQVPRITIPLYVQGKKGGKLEVAFRYIAAERKMYADCRAETWNITEQFEASRQMTLNNFIKTVLMNRQFSSSLTINDDDIDEQYEEHDHHHETMRVMM